MIVWPSLTEQTQRIIRSTIPALKIKSPDTSVRMLKCIGKECVKIGKKHPENEMWIHIVNPYTINKKSAKRFCSECAKTYDGIYILEKPNGI